MINFLGDDVTPHKITFSWSIPHLNVFVDNVWRGSVSPNGWQGDSASLHHPIGEPILSNVHLWHEMSMAEMRMILDEWSKCLPPERCMELVIGVIAKQKKISPAAAARFLSELKIPCVVHPLTIWNLSDKIGG